VTTEVVSKGKVTQHFKSERFFSFKAFPKMRFPSSNEEKCNVAKEFLTEKAPMFYKLAEKMLEENGGNYFVGNSVCIFLF